MKVHLIPHVIFETTRLGFFQILHHWSVLWKITPLYFFSSNLIYFGQNLSDFWVVGWKFTEFPMSYLKPQPQPQNHSSVSWEISLLYFFSWNSIWFLQKEPTTVQNFRLLTVQVKLHQICILIGCFCWKYIWNSMDEICLMIPKSGAKLEQKLIFCFKNDKNLVNFDPSTKKSNIFAFRLVPFV